MAKKIPTEINKFLGLNMDIDGETQLKLGESPNMVNWKITDTFKLKKRDGYIKLFDTLNQPIQGMWYGLINGVATLLFACNGTIYKRVSNVNTAIGGMTNAKTVFFYFASKVYIMNGTECKYFDGTTFGDVAGYRPKIAIGTPPSGGIGGEGNGALYEQINVLTGAKHQTFSADGIATEYVLAEQGLTSVDFVKINGELKTVTTDYTVDLTNGKVTFVSVPTVGQDNVDIGWTKGTGQRDLILKCRAALLYGGANDTRVFVWGNSDYKNRRFYTGLADGVPSAEYFPANYYSDVGSNQYYITDIVKQQDRQIIFTENKAFYSYLESVTLTDGTEETAFPVYPLNDTKGNIPFNQARVINNNPYTVHNGVYEWTATNVRDERNVKYIGSRIQSALDLLNCNDILTFDNELNGEYWLCCQKSILIHNYRNDTWYKYELAHTPSCFLMVDDVIYFGTTDGYIMKFDSVRTDNGTNIDASWDMHFYDFDIEYIIKYINKIWVSLQPKGRSSVDLYWESNNGSSYVNTFDFGNVDFDNFTLETNPAMATISYDLFDYASLDYVNWTYKTQYNPQPFRVKLKAKKFTYFKLVLKNGRVDTNCTVLSLNFLTRLGGESK